MSLLWLAALPLVVGYLGIVQVLRFKRLQALEKRWASKIDTLSYVEALEIVRAGHYFEHPFLITLSLSMALFQTYAIPTISKLLAATGQLSSPTCVGRRAEDTVVLLTEALVHGLDSERGSTAVARSDQLSRSYCFRSSLSTGSTGCISDMDPRSQTTTCSSRSASFALSRFACADYTNGANLPRSSDRPGSSGGANLALGWVSGIYRKR